MQSQSQEVKQVLTNNFMTSGTNENDMAMKQLENNNQNDILTVIKLRLKFKSSEEFSDSNEREFAKTVIGLPEDKWVKFVKFAMADYAEKTVNAAKIAVSAIRVARSKIETVVKLDAASVIRITQLDGIKFNDLLSEATTKIGIYKAHDTSSVDSPTFHDIMRIVSLINANVIKFNELYNILINHRGGRRLRKRSKMPRRRHRSTRRSTRRRRS
jgi:hypothetical protein